MVQSTRLFILCFATSFGLILLYLCLASPHHYTRSTVAREIKPKRKGDDYRWHLEELKKGAKIWINQSRLREIQETLEFVSEIERGSNQSEGQRPQHDMHQPRTGYENLRRSMGSALSDFWLFFKHELNTLKNGAINDESAKSLINHIIDDGGDELRYMMGYVNNLSTVDGYSAWREKEARELSLMVQKRIRFVQNPPDCRKAKKIVCDLKVSCGFSCQSHHVAFCLIFAYATGRTLILESKGWDYASEGWEKFMLPLSETCLDGHGDSTGTWGANDRESLQVIRLPIMGYLKPSPDFIPEAIPEDLAERLTRLHGYPFIWWAGQIMTYIQRPNPALQEEIDSQMKKIGFVHPIVGVQIRRTDKLIWEAKYHSVEEYMFRVEEFYKKLEKRQNVTVKRVFLATDAPDVLTEAKNKYPDFEFISNVEFTNSANPKTRFTADSLKGIIIDIFLLSRVDFLVCTFSSNVCRHSYALMQYHHPDASDLTQSVDWMYKYSKYTTLVAVLPHKPRTPDELELRPGDLIQANPESKWDGYTTGKNLAFQPERFGRFPSYKAKVYVETAKMPTYPEAENMTLIL